MKSPGHIRTIHQYSWCRKQTGGTRDREKEQSSAVNTLP